MLIESQKHHFPLSIILNTNILWKVLVTDKTIMQNIFGNRQGGLKPLKSMVLLSVFFLFIYNRANGGGYIILGGKKKKKFTDTGDTETLNMCG